MSEEVEDLKRKRSDVQPIAVEKLPTPESRNPNETVESEKVENEEPTKKKKKEFQGKTNFVNDDNEDILESGWFYIDSSNNPQGPFSSKEMKQWYAPFLFPCMPTHLLGTLLGSSSNPRSSNESPRMLSKRLASVKILKTWTSPLPLSVPIFICNQLSNTYDDYSDRTLGSIDVYCLLSREILTPIPITISLPTNLMNLEKAMLKLPTSIPFPANSLVYLYIWLY